MLKKFKIEEILKINYKNSLHKTIFHPIKSFLVDPPNSGNSFCNLIIFVISVLNIILPEVYIIYLIEFLYIIPIGLWLFPLLYFIFVIIHIMVVSFIDYRENLLLMDGLKHPEKYELPEVSGWPD